MGEFGGGERPLWASRIRSASQTAVRAGTSAARASAAAAGGTGRTVHRMTSASGAGRTGLASLLELSITAGIGDAFVVIALAGTLFFSSTAEQARGRAAIALIVTIAPYAILAPLIGPMLDRVRRGNKFILLGTVLARGLLCWGMAGAVAHNDAVTLLPAALGVLVLQKAHGVTKSAVTPRLLPPDLTLVSANSRFNLASLVSTSVGAIVAVGIDHILGDHSSGAAWVLRLAVVIYLAAMVFAFRLPDTVDDQHAGRGPAQADTGPHGTRPFPTSGPGAAPQAVPAPTAAGPDAQHWPPGRESLRKPFRPPPVGPAVAEAIRTNAVIRIFYGFMISFLAFILRTEKFGHVSDKVALAGLAAAVAVGGLLGTGVGSALRARAPRALMFAVLTLSMVITIACAAFFGLTAVLIAALTAAIAQTLVKASLDSVLQGEIGAETRSSAFAFSETIHQLALVLGGLLGLALSLTNSGLTGLTMAAVGLALALGALVASRRRRILRARVARSPAR